MSSVQGVEIQNALDSLQNSELALTPAPTPAPTQSPTSTFVDVPPKDDPLLHFLTTSIMSHGNRANAAKITSQTLLHIHTLTRAPPMPILRHAILLASPAVKATSATVRGKMVPRPKALSERQRTKLGIKWILEATKRQPGRTLQERLAKELISILQGNSDTLKKKSEVHRFAMVNRCVIFVVESSTFLMCGVGEH